MAIHRSRQLSSASLSGGQPPTQLGSSLPSTRAQSSTSSHALSSGTSGYLPNGNGGWVKARHKALINDELWNLAQEMRQRNATSSHRYCTERARTCSLSGITYCWYCKVRIHVACSKQGKPRQGKPRLGCYNRIKGWDCPQRSVSLEVYEEQIREYLKTFHIPGNYQERVLEAHRTARYLYGPGERENKRAL